MRLRTNLTRRIFGSNVFLGFHFPAEAQDLKKRKRLKKREAQLKFESPVKIGTREDNGKEETQKCDKCHFKTQDIKNR